MFLQVARTKSGAAFVLARCVNCFFGNLALACRSCQVFLNGKVSLLSNWTSPCWRLSIRCPVRLPVKSHTECNIRVSSSLWHFAVSEDLKKSQGNLIATGPEGCVCIHTRPESFTKNWFSWVVTSPDEIHGALLGEMVWGPHLNPELWNFATCYSLQTHTRTIPFQVSRTTSAESLYSFCILGARLCLTIFWQWQGAESKEVKMSDAQIHNADNLTSWKTYLGNIAVALAGALERLSSGSVRFGEARQSGRGFHESSERLVRCLKKRFVFFH